jgi:hypothetical protein
VRELFALASLKLRRGKPPAPSASFNFRYINKSSFNGAVLSSLSNFCICILSTILFFSIKKYFSALRKLKQKDHKFEGRLGYIYI